MWIYSLGITLKKVTLTSSSPYEFQHAAKNASSLNKIITAMCEPRLLQRASLMFLLDVSTVRLVQFIPHFYELAK